MHANAGKQPEAAPDEILPLQRFRSTLGRGLYAALFIHLFFIVLFYARDVYVLICVNIVSVLIYVICIWFFAHGYNRLIITLVWVEVLVHAVVATVWLGWASGFHYYLIIFVPLIFANAARSIGNKITFSLLLGAVYVVLDYTMGSISPLSVLPPGSLNIMRYSNIVICLGLLGYLVAFYSGLVVAGAARLNKINQNLEKALAEVNALRGIIPLCSFCKKIRDDTGYWNQVDVYIQEHSQADISHSICPDCMQKHYPEVIEARKKKDAE
jgi:hypothetical protein